MPEKPAPAIVTEQPEPQSYKRLLNQVIGLVETGRATAGRVVIVTINATC